MATAELPILIVQHLGTVYLGHDDAGNAHYRPLNPNEHPYFVWQRVPLKAAWCDRAADNDHAY